MRDRGHARPSQPTAAAGAGGQQRRDRCFERVRHVAEVVAAKRFVAAVAAERDGDVATRRPDT